jgi:hypothetical protein
LAAFVENLSEIRHDLPYKARTERSLVYFVCICHIRGRVSKQVTNGSKTTIMDVIRFLCVSLGSSAVQLHDSLASRRACACSKAGFSSQNGDRA